MLNDLRGPRLVLSLLVLCPCWVHATAGRGAGETNSRSSCHRWAFGAYVQSCEMPGFCYL